MRFFHARRSIDPSLYPRERCTRFLLVLISLAKEHVLGLWLMMNLNEKPDPPFKLTYFRHRCGDTAGAAAAVVLVDPAATAYK